MANGRKEIPKITFENLKPPYLAYKYFADSAGNPFDHGARGFSLVNAWWLADASTLVYAEPDFVRENFRRAGLTEVREFSAKGTECFVASNEKFAIVAFRGTETSPRRSRPRDFSDIFLDLATDVDFIQSRFAAGGKVHHGFEKSLDNIWPDRDGREGLKSYLARFKGSGRTIWFTGHSLGAALTTLAAASADEAHGIYTFGSPRVGDRIFTEKFRQIINSKFRIEHYRFVHDQDIVTTVPPEGFYRHVDSLKHIDQNGALRDSPSLAERLKQKLRGIFTMPFDNLGRMKSDFIQLIPEGIADHVPVLYATHIWNAYTAERR